MEIKEKAPMFATYPFVVQHPNGTYTRGPWMSVGASADWTVSPQTGQVTVNSTYAPYQNMGPNDPNCITSGLSEAVGGITPTPDAIGSYRYEPWAIYAYGNGGYEYQSNGGVCINQPFTCVYLDSFGFSDCSS
jgi:hypothetical protein